MTVLKLLADAFHEGGWGMWPILTLLMITVSIITERAVVLRKAVIDKDKLLALLRSQISQGNIQGAIKVCSGNPTPLTRIVQTGLMRANRSEVEIVSAWPKRMNTQIDHIAVEARATPPNTGVRMSANSASSDTIKTAR